MIHAESVAELQALLPKLVFPADPTQRAELATLMSLSYSPVFGELFDCAGSVSIERGDDPPDFVIGTSQGRTSLEITTFTTPQSEIFHRERSGPGLYTSTLRAKKPDKSFWQRLRGETLPDDSAVAPHAEAVADLDADYLKAACQVLAQKHADLPRYHAAYARRLLLVQDKLSGFTSDFERRLPELQRFIATLPATPRFDHVLIVNGNHHYGVFAAKL